MTVPEPPGRVELRRRCLLAAALATPLAGIRVGAAQSPFEAWLEGLARDARAVGVARSTIDVALSGIQPIPRVIELDRRQPEGRMSFRDYRTRVVNPGRIETGRRLLADHGPLLVRIEARFGVPARVLVTLWGVESNFGSRPGGYPVIASLATLAFDGRRAAFFRRELISALRILDAGDIEAEAMRGSWAGAMGQPQFMPSTYLDHAIDLDGDGRRDIWSSVPDVLGSAANYLARAGWRPGQRWGRAVLRPASLEERLADPQHRMSVTRWSAAGVRTQKGDPLPPASFEASLIQPDGAAGDAWLAYPNFRAIMTWNRSTYFALSVGLLSDALEDSSAS